MSGSASVASGNIGHRTPPSNSLSKLKTYEFAAAIIIGIIGLGVGATGLAGYFHVGTLSNMTQLNAIIMMAIGNGCGVILLIIGITGVVKNRQTLPLVTITSSSTRASSFLATGRSTQISDPTQHTGDISSVDQSVDQSLASSIPSPSASSLVDVSQPIDTQGGVFYGPTAWRKWNVEVLDTVPPAPTVDLSNKDKVLLYIPQRIRVNGQEQNLTLKTLQEIVRSSFVHRIVEIQFGYSPASGGWVLIDKAVIPESRGKSYEAQQKMVEERECSMPSALEATILNLMVFAFTGERLYGSNPVTYTRCLEKVDGREPVIVGSFDSYGGLCVGYSSDSDPFGHRGVACVRRKF